MKRVFSQDDKEGNPTVLKLGYHFFLEHKKYYPLNNLCTQEDWCQNKFCKVISSSKFDQRKVSRIAFI